MSTNPSKVTFQEESSKVEVVISNGHTVCMERSDTIAMLKQCAVEHVGAPAVSPEGEYYVAALFNDAALVKKIAFRILPPHLHLGAFRHDWRVGCRFLRSQFRIRGDTKQFWPNPDEHMTFEDFGISSRCAAFVCERPALGYVDVEVHPRARKSSKRLRLLGEKVSKPLRLRADTVGELKEQIEQETGISKERQHFERGDGYILTDDTRLDAHSADESRLVFLNEKTSEGFIDVRIYDGDAVTATKDILFVFEDQSGDRTLQELANEISVKPGQSGGHFFLPGQTESLSMDAKLAELAKIGTCLELVHRCASHRFPVQVTLMSGTLVHKGEWSVFNTASDLLNTLKETPWWANIVESDPYASFCILLSGADETSGVIDSGERGELRAVLGHCISGNTLCFTAQVKRLTPGLHLEEVFVLAGLDRCVSRNVSKHLIRNDVKDPAALLNCAFRPQSAGDFFPDSPEEGKQLVEKAIHRLSLLDWRGQGIKLDKSQSQTKPLFLRAFEVALISEGFLPPGSRL